jgi:hypothetical protein
MVTVAIPPEEVTETADPVKLIPVAPSRTRVPSSKIFTGSIAAPQMRYAKSFHGLIPSPILRQSVSVSYPLFVLHLREVSLLI